MAGRTGGAYAAQIATMEGNEEIDALRALGISPYQYLVVPRVAALVAMTPVMYFYACLVGLAGGLLTRAVILGMAPPPVLPQLRAAGAAAPFYIPPAKRACFGPLLSLPPPRPRRLARPAPSAGRVRVDGEDYWSAHATRRLAIGRRFGVLFQSGALWSSLTVGENVALPLQLLTQLDGKAIGHLVGLKLALVGMAAAENKY